MLFIADCGAAGHATRRDLSGIARVSFWALIALIAFGIVMIFINTPGGSLAYSVLGLVIFAGLTMVDFQRIRRSKDLGSAPLIARLSIAMGNASLEVQHMARRVTASNADEGFASAVERFTLPRG
jgi:FtsH-binding integral membrane protein